ncbi:MAG: hypothetical protein AAF216_01665 [Pseudomonadota bacterium]
MTFNQICSAPAPDHKLSIKQFDASAISCALSDMFQDQTWRDLSDDDRRIAAGLLSRLYLITRDETLRAFPVCELPLEHNSETLVNTSVAVWSLDLEAANLPPELKDEASDVLWDFFDCAERGIVELPVERDTDFDMAIEAYERWSGQCHGDDGGEAGVMAGVRLMRADALECALSTAVAKAALDDLDKDRLEIAAPFAATLVGLGHDKPWAHIDPCQLNRWKRIDMKIDASLAQDWVIDQSQLRGVSPPVVDNYKVNFFFVCKDELAEMRDTAP